MVDNFGLKIGIEGERQFKAQLAEINQTFKVLGSEMKLVDSQFEKQDKSEQALTARNEVLQKSIDAQKEKMKTLQTALNNASDSFGNTDKRTKNWQIQLNNTQSELNKMEKELESNNSTLSETDEKLEDTKKSTEKLGDELKDSGKKADESSSKFTGLGKVCKTLSIAMVTTFAVISAGAIAAGKALVNMAKEGAAYADNVLTTSTVTGIATDKLQEFMYAAEIIDVSVETLTGSMAKNIKSMKSAIDGSSAYVEAYEKLGVAVTDTEGNFRDSDAVYWELIDALGKMENETERDALAMQLLGRSAQDLNPLISVGSEKINELTEKAKEAGYVISNDMLDSYGALDDQLQYLKNGCQAAKNALGSVLLPILTKLATEGVSLLGQFTRGILDANGDVSKIGEVFSNTIKSILDTVLKNIPILFGVITSVITSMGSAILDNLDIIVNSLGEIITTILKTITGSLPKVAEGSLKLVLILVNAILSNLPQILNAAMEIVAALAQGIAEAIPELIPAIIEVVVKLCEVLIANLPLILDAALNLIKGLAMGILKAIPVLLEALPELITSIINFIVSSIPEIINVGVELITSLVDALPDIISTIVAVIPDIINGIINAIMIALPSIIEAGINLFVCLIKELPKIIEYIVNAIPQIITGILNSLIDNFDVIAGVGITLFTSLISRMPEIVSGIIASIPQIILSIISSFGSLRGQMGEIGQNLVKGLWDGIQTLKDWLWDKVSSWCSDLWKSIKNFFGISSPSKKMMLIGSMLVEGLSGGIDANSSAIKSAENLTNNLQSIMGGMVSKSTIDVETDIDSSKAKNSIQKAIQNLTIGAKSLSSDFSIGASNRYEENTTPIEVNIPLYLDGELITKATSRIQSTKNVSLKRAMGV